MARSQSGDFALGLPAEAAPAGGSAKVGPPACSLAQPASNEMHSGRLGSVREASLARLARQGGFLIATTLAWLRHRSLSGQWVGEGDAGTTLRCGRRKLGRNRPVNLLLVSRT
jgi:hypothetical protein